MAAPAVVMPDPSFMNAVMYGFTSVLLLGWTGVSQFALWLAGQITAWFLISMMLFSMTGLISVITRMMYGLILVAMFVWTLTHMAYLTDVFGRMLVTAGLMMGGNAMSTADFMNPTRILALGWDTTGPLYVYAEQLQSSWWNAIMAIGSILIYDLFVLPVMWIAYFIVATHVLLAVIEFKIVSIWALFFLPTLIFRPTSWIGHGAIHGVFDAGVRLGVLAFVVGISMPWVAYVAFPPNTDITIWSAISAGATAGLIALISWKAPNYAASLFAHGPAFTGSQMLGIGVGLAYGGMRAGTAMHRWGRS